MKTIYLSLFLLVVYLVSLNSVVDSRRGYDSDSENDNSSKVDVLKILKRVLSMFDDKMPLYGVFADMINTISTFQNTIEFIGKEKNIDAIQEAFIVVLESLQEGTGAWTSYTKEQISGKGISEYIEKFRTTLVDKLEQRNVLKEHISFFNQNLDPILRVFANRVYDADLSGMPFNYSHAANAIGMLSVLEHVQFANPETIKAFTRDIGDPVTSINTILSKYVDPHQVDLMLNLLQMFAIQMFKNQKTSYDERVEL